MRIAIVILAAATGCASTISPRPAQDWKYAQEVADRFTGPEPPPGAPDEYSLPASGIGDSWDGLVAGRAPVLPIRGAIGEGPVGAPRWCATDRGLQVPLTAHGLAWPRWRYYAGKRWLPDDRVTGLAPDGAGGVWARAETGYSHIHSKLMTLEEKARLFEERVRARHLRHGQVATCRLERPGDLTSSVAVTNDNDGLWTAMYVAAEAFRWAVTGEEEARRNARESYRAIERLQTISGIPGFPARSFVRADEPTGGGEWHPTPDGAWKWKGDTSSDEVDGHFFVAGVYFDLVAGEEEKRSIQVNVRAIMDHIIEHGYYLVDLDGKPTTWGVWAPEKLNHDPAWKIERGLNSLEVLSYLAVTEHITGDRRYRDAARVLIEEHGYAENTVNQKVLDPPEEINHSDDELAFLSYYNLMRYEEDRALRAVYLRSLARSFEAERPEANPLWTYISMAGGYPGAFTLGEADQELWRAAQTLRDTPMDLVEWRMENSHRRDLERSPHQSRFDRPLAAAPLHPAERGGLKYNSDPYQLDDGGDGRQEDDGSFFLLAYWMGRHHGFIAPPGRGAVQELGALGLQRGMRKAGTKEGRKRLL